MPIDEQLQVVTIVEKEKLDSAKKVLIVTDKHRWVIEHYNSFEIRFSIYNSFEIGFAIWNRDQDKVELFRTVTKFLEAESLEDFVNQGWEQRRMGWKSLGWLCEMYNLGKELWLKQKKTIPYSGTVPLTKKLNHEYITTIPFNFISLSQNLSFIFDLDLAFDFVFHHPHQNFSQFHFWFSSVYKISTFCFATEARKKRAYVGKYPKLDHREG